MGRPHRTRSCAASPDLRRAPPARMDSWTVREEPVRIRCTDENHRDRGRRRPRSCRRRAGPAKRQRRGPLGEVMRSYGFICLRSRVHKPLDGMRPFMDSRGQSAATPTDVGPNHPPDPGGVVERLTIRRPLRGRGALGHTKPVAVRLRRPATGYSLAGFQPAFAYSLCYTPAC